MRSSRCAIFVKINPSANPHNNFHLPKEDTAPDCISKNAQGMVCRGAGHVLGQPIREIRYQLSAPLMTTCTLLAARYVLVFGFVLYLSIYLALS
jgi:hypothetical protein